MMTNEEYTKFVNLLTPRAGVPLLGHGHIPVSHTVKILNFKNMHEDRKTGILCVIKMTFINILYIDCFLIKGLKCRFPLPFLIFIYSMMDLLICKYKPF